MTSLAQILLDAGHSVRGCDVADDFVTHDILKKLAIQIDVGFDHLLPEKIDLVVFTSAHRGKFNPMVQQAIAKHIVAVSQAEELARWANQKKMVAVCGVGGKSTVSAMITWIMSQLHPDNVPSFSVGVGNILGLNRTGSWNPQNPWFVTEADEYVIDPSAPSRQEEIVPRFSFLRPSVVVVTNLAYDHPDVYQNFAHTQQVFAQFFAQIKHPGSLIINQDTPELNNLSATWKESHPDSTLLSFGQQNISQFTNQVGKSTAQIMIGQQSIKVELQLPGIYNMMNAAAALTAVSAMGESVEKATQALADFPSTMRRFEKIGEKQGVIYFDDYAHHPNEVKNVIEALNLWYPTQRKVIAFQSHTFSRTKQLFTEFVDAFSSAQEVCMIDIFASARESFDPSITSNLLCSQINHKYPQVKAQNYRTIPELAAYLKSTLQPGDVCLTIGAGTIYQVHDLL